LLNNEREYSSTPLFLLLFDTYLFILYRHGREQCGNYSNYLPVYQRRTRQYVSIPFLDRSSCRKEPPSSFNVTQSLLSTVSAAVLARAGPHTSAALQRERERVGCNSHATVRLASTVVLFLALKHLLFAGRAAVLCNLIVVASERKGTPRHLETDRNSIISCALLGKGKGNESHIYG
jgi:hypothetical protein